VLPPQLILEAIQPKKHATRKGTTLIPAPGIKSQTSVRKSFNTDSAQKTGAANKLHCAPRRSQTIIIATSNESRSRKSSRQGAKKGTAMNDLLHPDQPSSCDDAKEENRDKLGSQNRHQLSKCKDSKDLPREFVENLETTPNHATLPSIDFDIQNMSVDTLMEVEVKWNPFTHASHEIFRGQGLVVFSHSATALLHHCHSTTYSSGKFLLFFSQLWISCVSTVSYNGGQGRLSPITGAE
jgi:hypothetical protein